MNRNDPTLIASGLMVLTIAVVSLIGHFTGSHALLEWGGHAPVSAPSVAAILILSVGQMLHGYKHGR